MHYLAYVCLDGFYVGVQRELGIANPLGVVVHRDQVVLDSDEVAQQRKVSVGMPLPEAKAILEGGTFVSFEEEPYRQARAKWLDRAADLTHALEPLDFHTALLDLSGHLRPERMVETLRELLPNAQIGVGRSRWVAQVTCGLKRPDRSALHDALIVSDFKVERLLPASEEDRARLRFLGYRTIGEVATLPLATLRRQFGEAGHLIHRAARGGGDSQVRARWPPDSVSGYFTFEGAAETEEVVRNGLQILAETLAAELDRRDLRGNDLVIFLETEAGPIRVTRTFARSIQSVGSIYTCLSLALSPLPEAPILSIRARMPNLTKARRVQLQLEGQRSKSDRMASVDAAFRHVRTVFGDGSLQVAAHVEEPRRKRVLRAWKDATGWN